MASDLADARPDTVLERLVEAADQELAEHGTLTGRFEAVAHRAGVSRATAYRQIGSVVELLRQVGLRRSQTYVSRLRELMDAEDGVLAKLEAAMIFGARVLPEDPIVMDLISHQVTPGVDPEFLGLVDSLMGSALAEGRRCGEIRSDIELDVVVGFLIEQSYLSTHAADRSEAAVRLRFRTFIEPAIAPRGAVRG